MSNAENESGRGAGVRLPEGVEKAIEIFVAVGGHEATCRYIAHLAMSGAYHDARRRERWECDDLSADHGREAVRIAERA